MTIFLKPESADTFRNENLIIGYYKNITIVKNEANNLFYIDCEPEILDIGTYAENQSLIPVSNLSPEDQDNIKNIFGENHES